MSNKEANSKKLLLIGGTHGVEPQSSYLVLRSIRALKIPQQLDINLIGIFDLYKSESITAIPDLNRFGLQNFIRGNEHGVDLNRNMPSQNWSSAYQDLAYFPGMHPGSEKQTKALVKTIKEGDFDLILSIHTNHYVQHPNPPQVNYDGIKGIWGHDKADDLAKQLELPLTDDIGYSTPGSLGSYCKDIKLPCITLEIDDKFTKEGAWGKYGLHLLAWLDGLQD